MATFAQMHNDYLDPDQNLPDEEPEDWNDMHRALADWYGTDFPPTDKPVTDEDRKRVEGHVKKWVFKATECGCCVHFSGPLEVILSGYVEGWDGDCPSHLLQWPFSRDEYYNTLEKADKEGVAIWNDTHGCDSCLAHLGGEGAVDEWENPIEIGNCPVWTECPECGGEGISL